MTIDRRYYNHPVLRFGSGDYYLFCDVCDARWVCCGISSDAPLPELANKQGAYGLSGERRVVKVKE